MPEPEILHLVSFLFCILVLYSNFSKRNLLKTRALTPLEYLWKLKQIVGKSEYDIFLIAAEEKGWPAYLA